MSEITVLTASIYGREDLLARNMESVRAQTVPVARHLVDQHDPESHGPIESYNQLATLVDTEWFAILDDDNYWLPRHVELIEPYLEKADVVYSWDAAGTITKKDPAPDAIGFFLKHKNFIDQSSAIRTDAFPGFTDKDEFEGDEMDWRLWRTMARQGYRFACCPLPTWVYGVRS